MKLLLDVGNTSVNWGVCRDGVLESTGCLAHRDEDFSSLALEAWSDLPAPSRVVVANVADNIVAGLIAGWAEMHWSIAPEFIETPAAGHGVTNAYEEPARLGVDRWAALVGAQHHYQAPVCVIDCGSAITVDLLGEGGKHAGGQILPGVEMLKMVLLENTAGVGVSAPGQMANVLAGDTAAAVNSGAIYMVVATLDRIISDMGATLGHAPDVVVSGGDAERILPLLATAARHDPDIVLKGLAIIAA